MPYLKEVAKNVNTNAEWYFSIYYNNPVERDERVNVIKQAIEKLGLHIDDCHTFQIR